MMLNTSRALLISLVLPLGQLCAQVGNDNPTGPGGAFNGSIGSSYDPYTGDAMRAITDIVVDEAVGTIPLAFSRIYNSRFGYSPSGMYPLGWAGVWRHSYDWYIPDTSQSTNSNPPLPSSYAVTFPDGRRETFVVSGSDVYYRTALGTRERFVPFSGTPKLGYLILPDGSKVEFKATKKSQYDGDFGIWYYWWTFDAQALIDPYGQRTTLTYNSSDQLIKVTEPGGRYLQFYYVIVGGWSVLDHVTASDGRSVQYYYVQATFPPGTGSYVCLDHIVYYGDATLTATYKYRGPNTGSANGVPLLWKCDDPIFSGPMKRIAYTYATTNNADGSAPVYGQILSENYYDGTNVGVAVSTLSVNLNTRIETRGDGTHPTRTFTYTSYKLTSETDFRVVTASKGYDANFYITSITDRNGHTTDFTVNALTGAVLTTTFPATPGDITPPNGPRGTVATTFGSPSCADVNNRDANNPYYVCTATAENGQLIIYTRDASKRVTRIDYPDSGYETFTYNSFGQILSHRLKTGGTETFTYDATGQKLTYRDPYHAAGNPTARYGYDSMSHLSGVTDALGSAQGDIAHTTSYGYNARGQLITTTHPTDPIDGQRHTVTNSFNPDGTVASTTDEFGHMAEFSYDDYKRLRTAKTPERFTGDTTPRTTSTFYDANGTTDDYTHTDSNVTYVALPGGEVAKTTYDENFRKTAVTAAYGTSDAATASYGYDNVGNVTSAKTPKQQPGQPYSTKSTVTAYDERNRAMSITDAVPNAPTTFKYDWSGRKASVTRPNGQIITFDLYDNMNRLKQQTVKQTPNPDAVTKYTYDSAGTDLWSTMQDPMLVAINSTDKYTFNKDQMGRKTSIVYPPAGSSTSEIFTYDAVGRLYTITNRGGKVQTFIYDALNRPTNISWNDSGITPAVTFVYDVGSRITNINNTPNATISRTYFNDNLLNTETTTYPGTDNTARTVTYTYDADARRGTIQYPNNVYSFTYSYTNRSQLWKIVNDSTGAIPTTNLYDLDGNLTTRSLNNSTNSSYTYDVLDRVMTISHNLVGTTRTLAYEYDSVSNRKWTKRDNGNADVFGYDLNDQATGIVLNTSNPGPTPTPAPQTITYDANGNRVTFGVYGGPTDTYSPNNLNQYTSRNSIPATYDTKGNMTAGVDGSTYTYDAQNRLLSAVKGIYTDAFKYDGLNRQISRTVNGVTTYNVYDGWDVIAEYSAGATVPSTAYLAGGDGLVKNLTTNRYYYQDASGSTSHLASNTGALIEWYRYDLQGTPVFYNPSNTQISASAYGIRHLFTGQQWYSELGLYDLRNRFYSPDVGRFLQADPIGFNGDATNLYRYCSNNPPNGFDPNGTIFGMSVQNGSLQISLFTVCPSYGSNSISLSRGATDYLADAGVIVLGAVAYATAPAWVPPGAVTLMVAAGPLIEHGTEIAEFGHVGHIWAEGLEGGPEVSEGPPPPATGFSPPPTSTGSSGPPQAKPSGPPAPSYTSGYFHLFGPYNGGGGYTVPAFGGGGSVPGNTGHAGLSGVGQIFFNGGTSQLAQGVVGQPNIHEMGEYLGPGANYDPGLLLDLYQQYSVSSIPGLRALNVPYLHSILRYLKPPRSHGGGGKMPTRFH